ncbi:flagellar motor protein MotB [Sphingomonas sp. HT-1]|jgi:chemotaxis protein MotB|uniref:flagellar motor protein MotB n=1 Tax=unclassified Sphingomonas TaxID=196159 RepID=UPI00031E1479|nr:MULTISPECIES: flagellar motor protein MotB [unclassified Sphingomonas]KTF68428.1 flagellar motor protein MotB [Sphingomonas sp. WG]
MARGGDARPIIVKKVKKIAGGHHGGAWKVAYADFVTAMMAFFMLLWLISNPDKDRLKGLAKYFSPTIADNAPATPVSNTAPGAGGPTRRSEADPTPAKGQPTFQAATAGTARGGTADVPATMRVMASELMVALEASPDAQGKKNIDIQQDRFGLRITLMDTDQQSMFKPGTADLNPYARQLLAKVAGKIANIGAQIAIEGHTDGAGGQSDANWLLSGQRALAARSALVANGVTADRFAEVIAMGATQPVYPDQPARAENRRISIVLRGQTSALPSDSSFKF